MHSDSPRPPRLCKTAVCRPVCELWCGGLGLRSPQCWFDPATAIKLTLALVPDPQPPNILGAVKLSVSSWVPPTRGWKMVMTVCRQQAALKIILFLSTAKLAKYHCKVFEAKTSKKTAIVIIWLLLTLPPARRPQHVSPPPSTALSPGRGAPPSHLRRVKVCCSSNESIQVTLKSVNF